MSLQISENIQSGPAPLTPEPDASGHIVVPDAAQLFSGAFSRSGNDLTISYDGVPDVYLPGYFAASPPAGLFAPDGAVLRGDLVELLAGPLTPGQYAQAGAAQTGAAAAIGQVETAEGETTVQRADGTVETLQVGTKVFQQDVLITGDGASVSVTFVDGTIFTLSSASRMVIDELIFDPDANDNSGSFSLIQGGFVFIAGQVAKTGGMEVSTPSSTMGIRGTTVLVSVGTDAGVVTSEITLTRDPDGDVGQIEVFDLQGNLLANISGTDVKWLVSSNGESREVPRTLDDDASDNLLIAEAFAAFRSAVNRVEAGDTFVSLGDAGGQSATGSDGGGAGTDLEVDSIDEADTIEQPPDIQGDDAEDFTPFDEGLNLLEEPSEPPVILVSGPEDATAAAAITGSVSVISGGVAGVTFAITSAPGNGTASLNPDGTFDFVPDPDFNGTDTFTVTATDAAGGAVEGFVIVTVLPVNDAPQTTDQSTGVSEDNAVIGVIAASDIDGDLLTFSITATPSNGAVALQTDGTYSYTPDADFAGTDSFTVRVTDPAGDFADATVSVTVSALPDVPVVVVTSSTTTGALTDGAGPVIAEGTLVAEDADADAVLVWSGAGSSAFGSFSIAANGDWTYALDAVAAVSLGGGEVVTETYTATVTDDTGATADQVVTITLTGTDDLPVITSTAADASGAVPEGSEDVTVSGQITATDPDTGGSAVWSVGAVAVAYGSFTLLADGTWSYTLDNLAADPLDLGETVTETLTALATDITGQQVTETVSVVITGTNDTPELVPVSVFETVDGEAIGGTLTASDVDGAGTLTFSVTIGPDDGTVTLSPDGIFSYTPDPGFLGIERITYQVDDGAGGVSTARLDIVVENSDASGDDNVSIGLSTGATAETAAGAVAIDVVETAATNAVNVVFVLDSSGSISPADWESLLGAVGSAVDILRDQFDGSTTTVDVQLISFSSTSTATAIYDLNDPGLPGAVSTLPYLGVGTNWKDALLTAGDFLLSEPAVETNYLIFFTDGQPNSAGWESAVDALRNPADGREPVIINAFGIGDVVFDELLLVDPGAQELSSPDQLTEGLLDTALFNPQLVSLEVELEVDGGPVQIIADETSDALIVEGVDYELPLASIENIAALLGDVNRVNVRAKFSTDSNDDTIEIDLFSSDEIGKAADAQDIAGLSGADLLFGSDQADTISGAGGNDVILGYDGDDLINGGTGDDVILAGAGDDTIEVTDAPSGTEIIDGGAGRDTLFLGDVGDINAVLASLDLTDIEVIDMDNGQNDTLTLSLADVVDLSSTADESLEDLLAAALPESATILGNAGDAVSFEVAAGDALNQVAGPGVTDADGNALTIYQYVGGAGEVLATLAIDSDVVVTASDGATV
ncbi:Ig-like domain-containing protein [Roseobacter ponti]|uniref:Tandem-95 repeat protein n=1 Tax=Roseobacter ponti TaxID=1891787 RepID=A0A858SXK1_9RHOB|nr:Ig-like domain-containing protein [Roseobacter ponti]QJF51606.1 tandem-95 repeat protein [Roseobacter ponti]